MLGRARQQAPFLVLVASLAITGAAAYFARRFADTREQARFEVAVQASLDRLQDRIDLSVGALLGGAGLFAASEEVTAQEFRQYVETVGIDGRLHGVQGIGFARRQGANAFPITYLQPSTPRNQAAMEYDMATESRRRLAIERARDTGLPSATGLVTLVQEIREPRQPGFLIYVPVYRPSANTLVERRERLIGMVYSPFRAHDFVEGVFGLQPAGVDFSIYEGNEIDDRSLLYRSQGYSEDEPLRHRATLSVAGREWTVLLARARLPLPASSIVSWLTLLLGTLTSAALFAFTWRRQRSEESIRALNAELERQVEAQVTLAAALQEAVRVRDEFLSIASHELRTPLASLKMQLHMLQRSLHPTPTIPPQRIGEKLGVSLRQTERLTMLVNNLLDVSRITSGKMELRPEPVDLSKLISQVAERFQGGLQKYGAPLDLQLEPGLSGAWDPFRLDQVITNLLGNALKYGVGRPIAIRTMSRGPEALIEVEDHGIGIAPDDRERIFERFERASSEAGGLGLGLYITRQIVEAHGGTVTVADGNGQGTIFRVLLPLQPAAGIGTSPAFH
jgi:signal transduction histidine kinase